MKTKLLFLCLSLTIHLLSAQVVLDKAMNPKIGQCFALTGFKIDSTSAKRFKNYKGTNHTWDLSKIPQTIVGKDTMCFIEPYKTPYANLFPNATIAKVSNRKAEYEYYYTNNEGFDIEGVVFVYQDKVEISIYTDPPLQIAYPCAINSKEKDDYKIEKIEYVFQEEDFTYQKDNYQVVGLGAYLADNYGTVIVPGQSPISVLSVMGLYQDEALRTTEEGTESYESVSKDIQWYSPTQFLPVLSLTHYDKGDSVTGATNVLLKMNDLKDKRKYPLSLFFYPDKKENAKYNVAFELDKPEMVEISVLNIEGDKILIEDEKKEGAGSHIEKIDISSLKYGVYVLRVVAGNKSEDLWFLKQ